MALLGRFLSSRETEYYSKRAELLKTTSSSALADSPFLLTPRQVVTEMITRYELFSMAKEVSGAIVECGVARGNNLLLFSHLSSILEPHAINRRIVGFDTFAGFRSIGGKGDPTDISEKDFSDTSEELILQAIDLFDMNRAAGHMKRTEIVKGDATQTIPEYVKEHPEMTIALLYIDFDLYHPTRTALEHLYPLVCRGGIVVFDEINYEKFAGETAALKDVLDIGSLRLKRFYHDPLVGYFRKE